MPADPRRNFRTKLTAPEQAALTGFMTMIKGNQPKLYPHILAGVHSALASLPDIPRAGTLGDLNLGGDNLFNSNSLFATDFDSGSALGTSSASSYTPTFNNSTTDTSSGGWFDSITGAIGSVIKGAGNLISGGANATVDLLSKLQNLKVQTAQANQAVQNANPNAAATTTVSPYAKYVPWALGGFGLLILFTLVSGGANSRRR